MYNEDDSDDDDKDDDEAEGKLSCFCFEWYIFCSLLESSLQIYLSKNAIY